MGRVNYEALSAKYQRVNMDDQTHCVICGVIKDKDFHYPTGNNLLTRPPGEAYVLSTCTTCFGALTGRVRVTGYYPSVYELILWGKGRTRKGIGLGNNQRVRYSKKKYSQMWNLGPLGKVLGSEGQIVGICDAFTYESYDFDLWKVYVAHREELIGLTGYELRARCEELFPDQRFVDLIISCYNS